MLSYPKIDSLFLRDLDNNNRSFLVGKWAREEFEYLKNLPWSWTEKIDGMNIRVIWDGRQVHFRGRNDGTQIHTRLGDHLRAKFLTSKLAEVFSEPATLYGEGYGDRIQKLGAQYLPSQEFILFDVFCKNWLPREAVTEIAEKLDLPVVPVVGVGPLTMAIDFAAAGFFSQVAVPPKPLAEGIVMRPPIELQDRHGARIITKAKFKDFLRQKKL